MNRQIAQAADALDLIEACKTAKLKEATAVKLKLVVDEMQRAAKRFKDLAADQSVMSEGEFFAKALARAQVIKNERAIIARIAREKREREAAEREALQKELALIAA
jgi:hypothetical protein